MRLPPALLFVALAFFGGAGAASAQVQSPERRAEIEAIYPVMIQALEAGNFGQARNICDQVILWEPLNPVHHYNLACIEARAGAHRLRHAFDALEKSAALGFNDVATLQSDPDLSALRNTTKFAEIARTIVQNAIRTGVLKLNPPGTPQSAPEPSSSDVASSPQRGQK